MKTKMNRLRVQWTPDINQDIDAITNKNSPFYDKKLTEEIIKKYGSVDNFRKEFNQNKDE
jgi:superoxide dismutase